MTQSWLQSHFNSFVHSHVSRADLAEAAKDFPAPYFSAPEMTAIKAVWRSAKLAAHGRRIILAGRDVWIFEVLARREGANTLFLPALSRSTVNSCYWNKLLTKQDFLFDTGFSGTIPKKLSMHVGAWKLLSANSTTQQLLPRLLENRDLAIKIERTPKYWYSARLNEFDSKGRWIPPSEGIPSNSITDKLEFSNAALLTRQIWHDSSPRVFNKCGVLKRRILEVPAKVKYAD